MFDLMNLIIEKGADLNKIDKDKETPLILAVRARIIENVNRLVNNENIDMANINKDTAVHIACQNGFSEILETLIKHKANIHLKNKDGNMPIHIATIYKQRECVKMLIKAGADILQLNNQFKSAFAMSKGEITTLMKKEIEKFHKENKNLELRHADQVTIALSKNTRPRSRLSLGRTSRQNSQTQSRLNSRSSSRLSTTKQQTNRQQENLNSQNPNQNEGQEPDQSKATKDDRSTTKKKVPNKTEIEEYMDSINLILTDAKERFDKQINEVNDELKDLINDLGKYEIIPDTDDTNNGKSQK